MVHFGLKASSPAAARTPLSERRLRGDGAVGHSPAASQPAFHFGSSSSASKPHRRYDSSFQQTRRMQKQSGNAARRAQSSSATATHRVTFGGVGLSNNTTFATTTTTTTPILGTTTTTLPPGSSNLSPGSLLSRQLAETCRVLGGDEQSTTKIAMADMSASMKSTKNRKSTPYPPRHRRSLSADEASSPWNNNAHPPHSPFFKTTHDSNYLSPFSPSIQRHEDEDIVAAANKRRRDLVGVEEEDADEWVKDEAAKVTVIDPTMTSRTPKTVPGRVSYDGAAFAKVHTATKNKHLAPSFGSTTTTEQTTISKPNFVAFGVAKMPDGRADTKPFGSTTTEQTTVSNSGFAFGPAKKSDERVPAFGSTTTDQTMTSMSTFAFSQAKTSDERVDPKPESLIFPESQNQMADKQQGSFTFGGTATHPKLERQQAVSIKPSDFASPPTTFEPLETVKHSNKSKNTWASLLANLPLGDDEYRCSDCSLKCKVGEECGFCNDPRLVQVTTPLRAGGANPIVDNADDDSPFGAGHGIRSGFTFGASSPGGAGRGSSQRGFGAALSFSSGTPKRTSGFPPVSSNRGESQRDGGGDLSVERPAQKHTSVDLTSDPSGSNKMTAYKFDDSATTGPAPPTFKFGSTPPSATFPPVSRGSTGFSFGGTAPTPAFSFTFGGSAPSATFPPVSGSSTGLSFGGTAPAPASSFKFGGSAPSDTFPPVSRGSTEFSSDDSAATGPTPPVSRGSTGSESLVTMNHSNKSEKTWDKTWLASQALGDDEYRCSYCRMKWKLGEECGFCSKFGPPANSASTGFTSGGTGGGTPAGHASFDLAIKSPLPLPDDEEKIFLAPKTKDAQTSTADLSSLATDAVAVPATKSPRSKESLAAKKSPPEASLSKAVSTPPRARSPIQTRSKSAKKATPKRTNKTPSKKSTPKKQATPRTPSPVKTRAMPKRAPKTPTPSTPRNPGVQTRSQKKNEGGVMTRSQKKA